VILVDELKKLGGLVGYRLSFGLPDYRVDVLELVIRSRHHLQIRSCSGPGENLPGALL
jgi:hypothetical protein